MKPYPLILNLEGRHVVVVGGGRVAYRKIVTLLESGAVVTVVSPKLVPELQKLADERAVRWIESKFDEGILDELQEITLLFGTTDNRAVNKIIYDAALKRKIPCNMADMPDLCSFIVPAVISQGDLLIAVSTGGASPALARKIREDLTDHFGPEYAEMTKLMGELRKLVLKAGKSSDENKKLFTDIIESGILDALKNDNHDLVFAILKSILPQDIDASAALENTRS